MDLSRLWDWLGSLPMSEHIGATWWFPLLESIHVLTSTFVVGSILMVDLRLLGVLARQHPVSRITREILPWTWTAFVLSAFTGLGMFMSQPARYAANVAFQIKMVLLVLAGINMAIFHFRTARRDDWADAAAMPTTAARLGGACSLLLWVGVVLAGRWIGHLL
jgi:hypothetical protein